MHLHMGIQHCLITDTYEEYEGGNIKQFVANVLDNDIRVNEFKPRSRYYVSLLEAYKILYSPGKGWILSLLSFKKDEFGTE